MAKVAPPRLIQCYHCRHRFEVSGRAESTSCPHCNKPLFVGDVKIKGQRGPIRELRTCGRITITKRGRLICEHVEAHDGIECLGIIQAKDVLSGDIVTLGPKAQIKGDLIAPRLIIQSGARVNGGRFAVPDDPLELATLEHRAR